jgi:hypothetical protein
MTLLAGAAEADITPQFPVDLLGYVRRPLAARSAYERLLTAACVLRDDEAGTTVVIIAADVVGLTTPTANRIRARVGEVVGWLETMLAQEAAGGRATAVDGEVWAALVGDCAIAGAPGEIFGAIGTAVGRQSPAPVTIFAGYSQGSLGYVATPDEYPFGGYEPSVSHRGYGQPAPFSPEVAGIIERTAVELLREPFA